LAPGPEVFLAPEQARHGAVVLRLTPGAVVEVVGPAGLAPARVTTVFPPAGLGLTLTGPWARAESLGGLRLALALIQGPRFDWAVEKSVELGAGALTPLITERTKGAEARCGQSRGARWQRLAEEARKQCGRSTPLTISPVMTLKELLTEAGASAEPGFYLNPGGEPRPAGLTSAGETPLLVIGPEGGLSPAETAALETAGFRPWGLGAAILRSETAALAALAVYRAAREG
jgi:16S rRNA (uracil1498-N3)-methyltransferase